MDRWQKLFNVLLVIAGVLVVAVWAITFTQGDPGAAGRSAIALLLLAGAPLAAFWLTPGGNVVRLISVVIVFIVVDAANVFLLSLDDHMFLADYWPWAIAYVLGAGIYWWWHQRIEQRS